MAKSAVINVRVDRELKEQGEAVLREIGLSKSDLISMTFRQLVLRRGLPFEARIPNQETIDALNEPASKLLSYPGIEEAMDDMWGKD